MAPRVHAVGSGVNEPSSSELTQPVHQIAHRVGSYLERQGWLERDAKNDYLALYTADSDPFDVLRGYSITHLIGLCALLEGIRGNPNG